MNSFLAHTLRACTSLTLLPYGIGLCHSARLLPSSPRLRPFGVNCFSEIWGFYLSSSLNTVFWMITFANFHSELWMIPQYWCIWISKFFVASRNLFGFYQNFVLYWYPDENFTGWLLGILNFQLIIGLSWLAHDLSRESVLLF